MKFRNIKTNEHVEAVRATGDVKVNGVRPDQGQFIVTHADGSKEIVEPRYFGADSPERLYEELPS